VETNTQQAANLRNAWETDQRWNGIERTYTPQDVIRLRESAAGEHALASRGASRLWDLLQNEAFVGATGAGAGIQAEAVLPEITGLQAVYLPDGTADSAAQAVLQVNRALLRAEQPAVPVVAGCGGALDAFELMKSMIAAGAAGVHFEDQLTAETSPGRKILIPTAQHVNTLTAARLAADVCDVPSLVIARTAAHTASLLSSDAD
jgi:isocitrate lyase